MRNGAETPEYKAYVLSNFRTIPQLENLPEEKLFDIEAVGNVLPFKTNNYVVNYLIDWDSVPNDPMFILNFPQKDMLTPQHYKEMAEALRNDSGAAVIRETANKIRLDLNPHPAGQMKYNIPMLNGEKLSGMQHKYKETVLIFPIQGQTCHAYCSFCFRWPQFVGINEMKFAAKEAEKLIEYLKKKPFVTDVLFTGRDPMIISTNILEAYIRPLLELDSIKTIRIGTKTISYWPYRFFRDPDSEQLMQLFRDIVKAEKHMAIMAHFNHPRELEPEPAKTAIEQIRGTGANIRTQSPLLKHINDSPEAWRDMWQKQVELGCVPYYMFIARNTGAQHYFAVPLYRAWQIFREAYQKLSGLGRTVRGPSMSTGPGKIHILGVQEINGGKVFVLQFLQGRNPEWAGKPFFAKFSEGAVWLNDLEPYEADKFFFEDEYRQMLAIEDRNQEIAVYGK